jgi:hypothetical protein
MSLTLATSKNLTILGVLALVKLLSNVAYLLFDGNPATNPDWNSVITEAILAMGLILGKGAQSTGGTVPQTEEAVARTKTA